MHTVKFVLYNYNIIITRNRIITRTSTRRSNGRVGITDRWVLSFNRLGLDRRENRRARIITETIPACASRPHHTFFRRRAIREINYLLLSVEIHLSRSYEPKTIEIDVRRAVPTRLQF